MEQEENISKPGSTSTHLDTEMTLLRSEIINMWMLVISQLQKTREALVNFDEDLAREIIATEKRVNSLELKIDRDCENIFALFSPVAVDLRSVLAILKINNNLERSGDIADSIAKYIISVDHQYDQELLNTTQIFRMYDETVNILEDVLKAFETEDTKLARTIFKRDELIDELNNQAHKMVADYIRTHPQNIDEGLYILSIIRKLERIGDHCKNMAEEIIFFVEAKVLKHKKKKNKEE